MTQYMKKHQIYILEKVARKQISQQLLDYHRIQIEHLKHERLVHLIVMCLFALMVMISIGIFIFKPILLVGLLFVVFGITECFYVVHYYRLENTVQRWYKIENSMIEVLSSIGTNVA